MKKMPKTQIARIHTAAKAHKKTTGELTFTYYRVHCEVREMIRGELTWNNMYYDYVTESDALAAAEIAKTHKGKRNISISSRTYYSYDLKTHGLVTANDQRFNHDTGNWTYCGGDHMEYPESMWHPLEAE